MKVRSLLLRAFRLLDFKNERGDSAVCVSAWRKMYESTFESTRVLSLAGKSESRIDLEL